MPARGRQQDLERRKLSTFELVVETQQRTIQLTFWRKMADDRVSREWQQMTVGFEFLTNPLWILLFCEALFRHGLNQALVLGMRGSDSNYAIATVVFTFAMAGCIIVDDTCVKSHDDQTDQKLCFIEEVVLCWQSDCDLRNPDAFSRRPWTGRTVAKFIAVNENWRGIIMVLWRSVDEG